MLLASRPLNIFVLKRSSIDKMGAIYVFKFYEDHYSVLLSLTNTASNPNATITAKDSEKSLKKAGYLYDQTRAMIAFIELFCNGSVHRDYCSSEMFF